MPHQADTPLRQRNKQTFIDMLSSLGRQDFDHCSRYLDPDIYADWPYNPAPGCPDSLRGRDQLLAYFQAGMTSFTPHDYRLDEIHELLDPNRLIAEYGSRSRFRPTDTPYLNRYCSVLHFRDGLITYWREYLNPVVVRALQAQPDR